MRLPGDGANRAGVAADDYPPPLAGIRIADFTSIAAGPYGSSLLGDLGADVIAVEPPGGEPFRSIDNIFGEGESAYHFGINRSKRSLALDLTRPESAEVVRRLIASADVCMVGFRGPAVEKLGLTYEHLSDVNPRLIYLSLTAFGEDGPRSGDPGMDIIAQALSGVMGMTGEPGRPPVKVGPPIADFVASFLLGFAICAALRARDRDGVGQRIKLNLLDGQVATLGNYITPYLRNRVPLRPMGGGHPQIVPYQVFAASDGYMIVACLNDRFWPKLCEAVGRPDLLADQRFATNTSRVEHREVLVPVFEELFAARPRAEWLKPLRDAGVPCSEVHHLEQAIEEPQVVHNRMIRELEHPRHGAYGVVDNPIRFERTPARVDRPVADLGEHNDEVLGELDFTAAEIEGLRSTGALR